MASSSASIESRPRPSTKSGASVSMPEGVIPSSARVSTISFLSSSWRASGVGKWGIISPLRGGVPLTAQALGMGPFQRMIRSRVVVPMLVVFSSVRLGMAAVDEAPRPSGSESVQHPIATLEDLMQRLAASSGVQARFRETRYVSLLTAPIESEGMLYFAPPDLLARYTTRPGRSSVVVRGSHVTLRDETGTQDLALDSSELASALIDHLIGLMRGDLSALRARHNVEFRLHGLGWELRLQPKSRLVRSVIDSIRIEGRGGEPITIEVVETSGDRTVTSFSEVLRGRTFTSSEMEELFPVGDPDRTP